MRRHHWTQLHARLNQTLTERQLLLPGQFVLVAVSGGQDSLCLLKLLCDLQPKWHWQLAVAHCDHRWRSDSSANALHVKTLAQSWELPFYLLTADVVPTSEASARTWRYQCLSSLAVQIGSTAVATGHTASDRAETLLYNLFRGSGSDGLQALTWQRPLLAQLALVRPLLNWTRAETAQFCLTHQLPIWEDSTNSDLTFARNRIRQEVLPYLRQHFNPQIEQTLAQTAELLDQEVTYLEATASEYRRAATTISHIPSPGNPELALDRRSLKHLPLALQRRIARQFLQTALGIQPNFAQVNKFIALIAAPNRSRTDPFLNGIIAEVKDDMIRLIKL